MLTKQQEAEVLQVLDETFDVQDVHFYKGKLFVINTYDVPAVEDFLETSAVYFQYQLAEEDVYAV